MKLTCEEIMAENSSSLIKPIDAQLKEAQWIPIWTSKKESTPRLIIVKQLKTKDKEKNLKSKQTNKEKLP